MQINRQTNTLLFFFCYFVGKNDLDFKKECATPPKFAENLYKPSADGEFTFSIINAPFDIKDIFAMRIKVSGSYIDTGYHARRSTFRIHHFNQTILPET